MPSSVTDGSRPISLVRRTYSSGLRPWAATRVGVITDLSGPRAASEAALRRRADLAAVFLATDGRSVEVFGLDRLRATFFADAFFFSVGFFCRAFFVFADLAISPKCHCRAWPGNPSVQRVHN